ncbi:hypothetical protein VNI00_006054 [Paramarasmius palmivorus]|uniref:Nephrocystin 3-like N-terminal domain-containing protein n=1 Tax=Paramarasmius palmivorus TaxID=297713 RepID=A0AAW0DG19_9AGAR
MAFNRSSNRIDGGAYNTVGRDQYIVGSQHTRGKSHSGDADAAFRMLSDNAAGNAFHGAEHRFPLPNCHPGTRIELLQKLSTWIKGDSEVIRVFWLLGTVGVGKSAIAQTLSERYSIRRIAAAFFFSRNDATRDRLDAFVATIVYQFSQSRSLWKLLGRRILKRITSDPKIFETTFENQFQKLIVKPSSKVDRALWGDLPNVIVIDGLDDCIDHRLQERLLHLIQKVTTTLRTPNPWRFLICSRPEPQIRDAFARFGPVLEYLDINSSEEANRDIELFFLGRFAELRRRHPALRHENESWPSQDVIDQLVRRAQGQFIFAVVVLKHVDTHDELPQDRLDAVLRIYVSVGLGSPYSDLDSLYHHVLSKCQNWERVRAVLRLLVTTPYFPETVMESDRTDFDWHSPLIIEGLLTLKKGEVFVLLSRLHSVLHIPDDPNAAIKIVHASFAEFLTDVVRSASYYIQVMSRSSYFERMATFLLRTISLLAPHYPLYQQQATFTDTLKSWTHNLLPAIPEGEGRLVQLAEYSYTHCFDYCTEVETPGPALLTALNGYDQYSFLAAYLYFFLKFPKSLARAILWAKGFGEPVIEFVKKADSCVQGFTVAFPPDASREEAFWFSILFEIQGRGEYQNRSWENFCRELYGVDAIPIVTRVKSLEKPALMVLPDGLESCNILPEGWTVVPFEDTSRYAALAELGEFLINDVRDDTWHSVSEGMLKKDDLICLKVFMKKWWVLFFHEDDILPRNSFANPSYATYPLDTHDEEFTMLASGEVMDSSIRQWFDYVHRNVKWYVEMEDLMRAEGLFQDFVCRYKSTSCALWGSEVLVILPYDKEASITLSEGWITVQLTRGAEGLIQELFRLLSTGRHVGFEKLLVDDIWEDTWNSLSVPHFLKFKLFTKKLWEVFLSDDDGLPPHSFNNSSYGIFPSGHDRRGPGMTLVSPSATSKPIKDSGEEKGSPLPSGVVFSKNAPSLRIQKNVGLEALCRWTTRVIYVVAFLANLAIVIAYLQQTLPSMGIHATTRDRQTMDKKEL